MPTLKGWVDEEWPEKKGIESLERHDSQRNRCWAAPCRPASPVLALPGNLRKSQESVTETLMV